MAHDFNDDQFWNQRIEVNMSVMHVMAAHGAIRLAAQHPRISALLSATLIEIADNIATNLIAMGALTHEECVGTVPFSEKEGEATQKG